MTSVRAMTERVLVLQPRSLAEVDAEREGLRAVQARTMAAVDGSPDEAARPPPPAPPAATAITGTRAARPRRRSSRVRTIAVGTPRPAPTARPAPSAPRMPLRVFDPTDPEPDYGAPFRRGWDQWMEEKAWRKEMRST